jgi:hypothetical protein
MEVPPGDPVVVTISKTPPQRRRAAARLIHPILMHGTKLELDGYAWLIGADRKSEELFIGSR